MKKQLLAAAVATAIAAPMAASADVTVYGQLHYSIDSVDYDADVCGTAAACSIAGTGMDAELEGFDGSAVNSHTSRFGLKGSEDLGNGLSLVFQMEFDISGDDLNNVGNNRNTYVALAGSWGVAGIGQVDTPFKSSSGSLELFSETVGDYNQLHFDDIRARDAVFYMSPNWNGFSFVGAVVLPSSSIDGGAATDVDSDGIEAVSISASYSNGPWFASLAYEDLSEEHVTLVHGAALDYDKWRLGLGYTANGFHVGYIYEDRDLDVIGDGDSWQLSGSYTAGNNTFKIAYGQADDMVRNAGLGFQVDDAEQWSVGVDHKLSNRTKVYAAYTDYSEDTADRDYDALSLGIVHKF